MPVAYEQALRSAQQLLEGATLAAESSGPQLQDAVCILKEAAQGVLEGTVKVCTCMYWGRCTYWYMCRVV